MIVEILQKNDCPPNLKRFEDYIENDCVTNSSNPWAGLLEMLGHG